MKKLIFFFILFIVSCAPKVYKLRGSFQDKPYVVESQKPFEEVWSNVIDLFAQKGISIKVIDKSSGLIVSEKASAMNSYTFESKKTTGKLLDSSALLVVESVFFNGERMQPTSIFAEWNIRIKNAPSGGTLINVNLTNLTAEVNRSQSSGQIAYYRKLAVKSTGNFERMMAEQVK